MKFSQYIVLIFSTLTFFVNSEAQTPQLVLDINPGAGDGLNQFNKSFAKIGETVFFTANDGILGAELYKEFNGSVSLVRDINPGAAGSIPFILAVYKDKVYFNANDGVHGPELWVSDGTEEGTTLFYESVAGPTGHGFVKAIVGMNNLLYFAGTSQLYMTNGSPDDVKRITCPHEMELSDADGGTYQRMIPYESGIAYAAKSADSVYVFKTSGPQGIGVGVTRVRKSTFFSGIQGMASVNERIVFVLDDFTEKILYSTTGNAQSVASKYSSPAGNDLPVFRFIPFNDDMVLLMTPSRLYGINGISTQTVNLGAFNTSFTQGVPFPSATLGSKAYFSISSFGDILIYETNGTLAGTKEYYNSPDITFGEMVSYGGSIFYTTGINNNFVPKIYQFESGDINPKIVHSYTANSTNGPSIQILGFKGNQMYFSSNLGAAGRELYKIQVDVNTGSNEALLNTASYTLHSAGSLTFQIQNAEANDLLELKMYDLQGKLFWSQQVHGNNSFQVPDIQGVFLLHVHGSEGEKSFKVSVWR